MERVIIVGLAGVIASGLGVAGTVAKARVPGADVMVSVSLTPNPVYVDRIYTATFRVRNRGPSSATRVVLAGAITGRNNTGSPLPRGGRVEAGRGCTGVSAAFRCSLGTMPPGATRTIQLRFRALASGTRTATATVTSRTFDSRRANNRSSKTIRSAARVGSRETPFGIGQTAALSDGWRVAVVSVMPDATAAVLAQNPFNSPPEPGRQFFIARLRATYTASGSKRLDASYRFRTVGPAAVSYSTFEDGCGVIPDRISDAEVFTGGTVEGNICWQVRSSDAAALVMYDDPFVVGEAERLWFRLTP